MKPQKKFEPAGVEVQKEMAATKDSGAEQVSGSSLIYQHNKTFWLHFFLLFCFQKKDSKKKKKKKRRRRRHNQQQQQTKMEPGDSREVEIE